MHKHERCRITLQPAVQKSPVFTLLPVVLVMELVLALVLILVLVANTVNAIDSAGTD